MPLNEDDVFFLLCIYLLRFTKRGEGEMNVDLSFHVLMHSLADSCVCPERGSKPPWRIRTLFLQDNFLWAPRARRESPVVRVSDVGQAEDRDPGLEPHSSLSPPRTGAHRGSPSRFPADQGYFPSCETTPRPHNTKQNPPPLLTFLDHHNPCPSEASRAGHGGGARSPDRMPVSRPP